MVEVGQSTIDQCSWRAWSVAVAKAGGRGTGVLRHAAMNGDHRWRIERNCLELKQELGRGHYEGRNWRGFHHHALPPRPRHRAPAVTLSMLRRGVPKNHAKSVMTRFCPRRPTSFGGPEGAAARPCTRAGI
ncbi:MAG: hypothetical protein EPN49_15390 [Rhodanobacter sp.]|nr:MAG: hypothetical protein EPN49_15390 [Rhodanobacter sp.]